MIFFFPKKQLSNYVYCHNNNQQLQHRNMSFILAQLLTNELNKISSKFFRLVVKIQQTLIFIIKAFVLII